VSWRELPIAIPVESEGIVLEGVWQSATGAGAVVAPPHPEYGGTLDHPVVNEVAYALYEEGYASVRFNWRGVGGSQGRISGELAVAEADYRAALEHVWRTVERPLLAAGYSFGAIAALRAGLRDPRVERLLLVAPPARMLEGVKLEPAGKPIRVIAGARDELASPAALSELLADLPQARLEVIPEADHFFAVSGLAELHACARAAVTG
jgi:alpha/beta superfamily hydrolase